LIGQLVLLADQGPVAEIAIFKASTVGIVLALAVHRKSVAFAVAALVIHSAGVAVIAKSGIELRGAAAQAIT